MRDVILLGLLAVGAIFMAIGAVTTMITMGIPVILVNIALMIFWAYEAYKTEDPLDIFYARITFLIVCYQAISNAMR